MNNALLTAYILCGVALLCGAYLHGKPRTDKNYNFFTVVINWAIRLTLIWWALDWRFA